MKSFREFAKENGVKKDAPNSTEKTPRFQGDDRVESGGNAGGKNEKKDEATAETLVKQIVEAYRGKSDKNVLSEIVSSAEKGKRDGTLTNAEIDAFYRQFSPMLNFVQRKKLSQIVERLKSI